MKEEKARLEAEKVAAAEALAKEKAAEDAAAAEDASAADGNGEGAGASRDPRLDWAPVWRCALVLLDALEAIGLKKLEQSFGAGVPDNGFGAGGAEPPQSRHRSKPSIH